MNENRKEYNEDLNRPNENDRWSDEIDENWLPIVEKPEKFEKTNDWVKQKLNFLVLMSLSYSDTMKQKQQRWAIVSVQQLHEQWLISDWAYGNAITQIKEWLAIIEVCNKDWIRTTLDVYSSR